MLSTNPVKIVLIIFTHWRNLTGFETSTIYKKLLEFKKGGQSSWRWWSILHWRSNHTSMMRKETTITWQFRSKLAIKSSIYPLAVHYGNLTKTINQTVVRWQAVESIRQCALYRWSLSAQEGQEQMRGLPVRRIGGNCLTGKTSGCNKGRG